MEYFWLAIVLILGFIEVVTVNLVTVWFVASAIISLLLSFLNVSFEIQFAVFVIGGIILLLTTRKWLVKILVKEQPRTNLDRVIGMEGIVTEKISKNKAGEIKVDGKCWTAVSNKTIEVGKTVKVIKIEGVKLIVEEV